ncbi:MAG: sensor histidine kinase [Oscillospiraceae bacterium]|nr:sensor histidine kinase [Oscillospiraceae bacterium]
MKNAFKNMVFWKKLVLVSVTPLLIISIMIGYLSYDRANTVVRESTKKSLADALNRIDISLSVRVRQLEKTTQVLASGISGALETVQVGAEEERLVALCRGLVEPFGEVSAAAIVLGEGRVYASEEKLTTDPTMLPALCAAAAMQPEKTQWSGQTRSIFLERQKGALPMQVFRAICGADGEILGTLILEVDRRQVANAVLMDQEVIPRQRSFLVGRDRKIIYSDGMVTGELAKTAMEQYQSGRRRFNASADGKDYFCCAQYNAMTGWVSFSAVEEEMLFSESGSLRRYVGILVLCCAAVAVLLQMALSRMITLPLLRLKEGMHQVQESNFEVQLENDRRDEIGELTDSFNYMVDQIRTLINRVYREQLAQKNAEIESLQAQINPHFLYNALDSVNWMLIERGQTDISSIVVAMAKLMQYSMNTGASMVTLHEEYDNARNYLMVQKNRLEDQLEYELELDAAYENFHVPKLILQPLVENSIKHGVVGSPHPCTVRVKTVCSDEYICITVSDNGVGMDGEKLARYRRLLAGTEEERRGIGIRNVARRLQLHFDGACEFSVESSPDTGTALCLRIPVTTREMRE